MAKLRKLEWIPGGSRRRKGAGGEATAAAAMGEGEEEKKAEDNSAGGGGRETAEGATNLLVSSTPLPASPTWRRGSDRSSTPSSPDFADSRSWFRRQAEGKRREPGCTAQGWELAAISITSPRPPPSSCSRWDPNCPDSARGVVGTATNFLSVSSPLRSSSVGARELPPFVDPRYGLRDTGRGLRLLVRQERRLAVPHDSKG